jgi:hypothetical protein
MSTATVLLDIEKAFNTIWHPGFLYKLYTLPISTMLIKLISSFLTELKFRVSVEGEIFAPKAIEARVPQGSVLSPTLYSIYINDTPKHHVFIWPSLPMTLLCMPQIPNRFMFSESCSAVSIKLRRGVSAGTLKSIGPYIFSV